VTTATAPRPVIVPRPPGELPRRAAAVGAGLLVVALALVPRDGMVVLAAVAAFAGGWECRAIVSPAARRADLLLSALLGLGCALACMGAVSRWPHAAWFVAVASLALFAPQLGRRPPGGAARLVAGPLWFGALPAFLALLRQGDHGVAWVGVALAASWGGAIGSYAVGRTLGRRPLAPRLSPAKTVEGAIGGFVVGSALAFLVVPLSGGAIPLAAVVWIAPLAQALSQGGDLLESAFKRRHGVKDSGRLLGAQGGVLDCVDGLCLAAPFVHLAAGFVRG